MRRLWIAIVVLMFATVGHAGKAEAAIFFYTGNELLEQCESDNAVKQSNCYNYLMGASDITRAYKAWGLLDVGYCSPDNATTGQLKKVVIKGLNEQPEELHLGAASLVYNIFQEAFPCD